MKKKIVVLVLSLALIFTAFAGCSKEAAAPAAKPAEGTTDSSDGGYKIAFIPGDMANESQAYSSKQMEKYAADYGLEISILDGQGDAQVQAQAVSNCIAQGMDAILINPNDINGIVPSLMEAKSAGIVVVMFSSDLPEEYHEQRDIFVGVNDNMAGEVAAQAFIDKFPEGAKIVEVGGQSGHDAQVKRHDGFASVIEGSNIEVIDMQGTDTWSTSEAMAITEDFIVKHGDDIQGVFCHWDNGATGVIEALKAANMNDVYVIGVDGCRAGFDQVKAGTQSVTIMQNFTSMSVKALETTKAALDGNPFEAVNYVALDAVSLDNIESFEYPEW